MIDKKQIEKWVNEKIISESQAERMLSDVKQNEKEKRENKKEKKQNKIIVAISTIGAILLGVGVILFVASNWKVIPDFGKIALLSGGTFGSYYLGYLFKYQKKNFPKVGASLLFLGALLFGATIVLIAQIYHLESNHHLLALIWLVGILPVVYALKSQPIAGLASLLFFVWLVLLNLSGLNNSTNFSFVHSLTLLLVGSNALFAFGGLHYLKEGLEGVARIYRIAGLKVLMIVVFLLTFKGIAGSLEDTVAPTPALADSLAVAFFAIASIIMAVVNRSFNKSKKIIKYEWILVLGMAVLSLIFYHYPSSIIYVFAFNLVMLLIIGFLIYSGYEREDMKWVDVGTFWLAVFIAARYFDLFWDLLDRAIFFIVGGLVLILGAIALEKRRRKLKKEWTKRNYS